MALVVVLWHFCVPSCLTGFEVARDICLLLLLFVAPVTASLALEGHLASQTLRRFVGLCPCHSLEQHFFPGCNVSQAQA
jgi:hypothetical protein